MKKIKAKLALIFTVAGFIILTGFQGAGQGKNCMIVVGIAVSDLKCTSGKTVFTATTDEGHYFISGQGTDFTEFDSHVKTTLKNKYGSEKTIRIEHTSLQPVAVVISYEKKVSGYDCKKNVIKVGFGKTATEAEELAAKSKKNDTPAGSYKVLETIYCKNN